jgi:hypothetical protein
VKWTVSERGRRSGSPTASVSARMITAASVPPFGPLTIHQSREIWPSKTPSPARRTAVSRSNLASTVRAP